MKKPRKPKKIIGRRERVNFPELGIIDIEAKIDTGAYTSSIHCEDVKQFKKDGEDYVSFLTIDSNNASMEANRIEWPVYKFKQVKNSFGQSEERIVIKTQLSFFDELYDAEISLADRSLMEYPVLLGRKVLKKKFLIDVSKVNYATKRKFV